MAHIPTNMTMPRVKTPTPRICLRSCDAPSDVLNGTGTPYLPNAASRAWSCIHISKSPKSNLILSLSHVHWSIGTNLLHSFLVLLITLFTILFYMHLNLFSRSLSPNSATLRETETRERKKIADEVYVGCGINWY